MMTLTDKELRHAQECGNGRRGHDLVMRGKRIVCRLCGHCVGTVVSKRA